VSIPYAEVIGDPVAHSKSPLIHGFWLDQLGIGAEYRRCHVRGQDLGSYFSERRADPHWRGCNITIPHKERVSPFLDQIDDTAARIGAVNTVYRGAAGALLGTNTDVVGVAEAVEGQELGGKVVCIIGAGGAARAAFAWLAGRGLAEIRAVARDLTKAVRVAGECGATARGFSFAEAPSALAGSALLINATQLGMQGQPTMPPSILAALGRMACDGMVFDMVYAPLDTAMLNSARQQGLRTADGLTMLIGQAASAFTRFFGEPAPRDHDAELRQLLTV